MIVYIGVRNYHHRQIKRGRSCLGGCRKLRLRHFLADTQDENLERDGKLVCKKAMKMKWLVLAKEKVEAI